MQKILLSCIIFGSLVSSIFAASGDKLELSITPIRTSILVETGQTSTGSVTLYNNSSVAYTFIMSAEDCTANTNNGTPLCKPNAYPGITPISLASWIVFDTIGTFSIPARGKRTITYNINTPANATPGGHYGVIYFNNINTAGGTSISMNRRLGSLLLVTVPGEIVVAPEFGAITVTGAGGGSSGQGSIFDLFSPSQAGTGSSNGSGKGLMMVFTDPLIQKPIIDFINPFWSAPELGTGTVFKTDISIPIDNKGTIHINPEGIITLHDGNGVQLRNIGIEPILNEYGAITGENRIIDYLKINDQKGNVLPGTSRIYTMAWNGFAHEYFTASGKTAIAYESPGEYYSRIAIENAGILYPWQKMALVHTIKKINAKVDLSYINPVTGEKVLQNSELPITIEYDEIIKTWNTGLLLIILLILIIRWLIKLRQRKNKHKNQTEASLMSYEIHALERARAMMYDKKKELSIRDEIKKKEKKVKHKKTNEMFSEITPEKVKKSVMKTVIVPIKRVVKKEIAIEKKAVATVKKTVSKNVVTPVKRAIKKDIMTPVKRVIKKAPIVEKKAIATVKKTATKAVVTPVKRAIRNTPAIEKKAVATVKKTVSKNVVTPVKRAIKKDIVTPVKRVIKKAPIVEKKAIATVKKTATKAVVTPVKKVIKKDIFMEKPIKTKEEKHSKKDHKKKHKK